MLLPYFDHGVVIRDCLLSCRTEAVPISNPSAKPHCSVAAKSVGVKNRLGNAPSRGDYRACELRDCEMMLVSCYCRFRQSVVVWSCLDKGIA